MAVVFLGNFDTPTPEVVACKTSGPGGWAPSHFPQAVQVTFVTSHKKC